MKHAIARFLKPVLRSLIPVRRQRHPLDKPAHARPRSCDYVCGPTAYRSGERPPRGEDSPLVRPYFVAHERQVAEASAVRRRLRIRHEGLRVAVHGVDLRPRVTCGAGAAA